jgi:hypothetical protein
MFNQILWSLPVPSSSFKNYLEVYQTCTNMYLMDQDINSDLSIKDALAREEKFFRTQPVCCPEGYHFHDISNSFCRLTEFISFIFRHTMVLLSTVGYHSWQRN